MQTRLPTPEFGNTPLTLIRVLIVCTAFTRILLNFPGYSAPALEDMGNRLLLNVKQSSWFGSLLNVGAMVSWHKISVVLIHFLPINESLFVANCFRTELFTIVTHVNALIDNAHPNFSAEYPPNFHQLLMFKYWSKMCAPCVGDYSTFFEGQKMNRWESMAHLFRLVQPWQVGWWTEWAENLL